MSKRKQITSQFHQRNNKNILAHLNRDIENSIVFNGNYHTYVNIPLLSVSSVLAPFMKVSMGNIPHNILEIAKVEGIETMKSLEYWFKNKIKDTNNIDFLSEKVKLMFHSVLQCLLDNEMKVQEVEKHITNSYWHSYIDCIVRDKNYNLAIIEIKTRSNDEIRETDILQVVTYARLIGANQAYIMICNKKTMVSKLHKINVYSKQSNKLIRNVNEFIKMTGLDNNYLLQGNKLSTKLDK